MMAESGIQYPATLAIVYKPAYDYDVPNDAKIRVLTVENKDNLYAIEGELIDFLGSETIEASKKVI